MHCLALALGRHEHAADVRDWSALFALAFRERCAALAWMRSGEAIRRHAPADVVAEWRRHALNVALHGERALAVLSALQRRMRDAGLETVSLKGPVLATELYGTPTARPIDDLDLFVARDNRSVVREMLFSDGWARVEASSGDDLEVFVRTEGRFRDRLDVLSRFPKHLPTGLLTLPESSWRTVEGLEVRAHAGPSLAPYLAGHLARDEFPPLLWYIDFVTLWSRLDDGARAAARARARELFLHRALAWAVERQEAVNRAAGGDAAALRLLGIVAGQRVQARRWLRDLRLAGSLRIAAWVIATAVLHPDERSIRGFVRMIARRLRRLRDPRSAYADGQVMATAAAVPSEVTKRPPSAVRKDF